MSGAVREEKVLLDACMAFVVRNGQVLLAHKTKRIGAGCRNGYGGGIELGESPQEAAIRELREESGLIATKLHKVAIASFINNKTDGRRFTCHMHVFLVTEWQGEVVETEEMIDPKWYAFDGLPLDELMPADRYWLPRVLAGERIVSCAEYTPYQQALIGEVAVAPVTFFDE